MTKKPPLVGPAPGFVKAPDYVVEVEPAGQRIRAYIGEACIADSEAALVMLESDHSPVFYFPREDVRADLIEKTDHDSF